MTTFIDFYLLENSITNMPLSLDFKKDIALIEQPNGTDYKIIKDFFNKNIGNEVEFGNKDYVDYVQINKVNISNDQNSSMSNVKHYLYPIQKITEIIKIETSKGNLFAFTVYGGSTPYYNLASDKKFLNKVDTDLDDIIKNIVDEHDKEKEQKDEEIKKDAEQKAIELKQQQTDKRREASKKGQVKYKQTIATKKLAKAEELKKAEEIKKLGTKSPFNGRFGYFDINEDQYRTLVGHLKKETNIIGDRFGYVWTPDTRTKDNRIFGEGRFYKIKGADKSKPESVFYLFMYFNKYLEDQGMIIFDGAKAFDDFLECGIVQKAFDNKKIGKYGNGVELNDYKQCYWINENPKSIAPPLNAENADEIIRLSEPQTKQPIVKRKRKVKKESTWFENALMESQ